LATTDRKKNASFVNMPIGVSKCTVKVNSLSTVKTTTTDCAAEQTLNRQYSIRSGMAASVSRGSSNKAVLSPRRAGRAGPGRAGWCGGGTPAAVRRRIGVSGPSPHYFIIASNEAPAARLLQQPPSRPGLDQPRVKRRHGYGVCGRQPGVNNTTRRAVTATGAPHHRTPTRHLIHQLSQPAGERAIAATRHIGN